MNRQTVFVAAAALLVVALAAFLLARRPREAEPPGLAGGDLYREACGYVSPDTLGRSWPGEEDLRALRAEWKTLGFRDSTICEELTRDWAYREDAFPVRVTNVTQTPTGRNLEIGDRLRLGERFLRHPRWRTGSMRHYPVLAAMLTSAEKGVLAFLAGAKSDSSTLESIAQGTDLGRDEAASTLTALLSAGWVRTEGTADSARYAIADRAIGRGGALQTVTLAVADEMRADFASAGAAFATMADALLAQQASLRGPCAQTGRTVVIEVAAGSMRRGRPGNAFLADVSPPGLSQGLFASERAFAEWRAAHLQARIGAAGPAAERFQRLRGTGDAGSAPRP